MNETLPASHIADAQLLTADGKVDLYKITLVNGSFVYVKDNNDVTWQGNLYQGTFIKLTDNSQSSTGQLARPHLVFANPTGIYSSLVGQGQLDNATVVRYRVLYADVVANNNIFQQNTWKIRRIVSLDRNQVTCELRDTLDGQFFMIPYRTFSYPEFPTVNLQ